MLTVNEVWAKLDALAVSLPEERVPLAGAAGRVLREVVCAPEDQPAFDRAAIDGYVARLDTPCGVRLRICGEIAAGGLAPAPPEGGEAWRLFTGSAVPAGEVGLVMREDTERVEGDVIFRRVPAVDWIRRRASQARAGAELLPAGRVLNAGALALLASVGVVEPLVSRRPSVVHLVTGGELLAPELPPVAGCIRDSNSTLIAALLAESGAECVGHARAGVDYAEQAAGLAGLLEKEPALVLISGGASGGEHDFTKRLLLEQGFSFVVEQVAARPGKPLLVAQRGAQIAIGLPGNPLSHFVCFHLFVARVLAGLTGAAPAEPLWLPLAPGAALRANVRETWWPATRVADGYAPLGWADSSDLTVLSRTHALLRVPSGAVPETRAEGLLV